MRQNQRKFSGMNPDIQGQLPKGFAIDLNWYA